MAKSAIECDHDWEMIGRASNRETLQRASTVESATRYHLSILEQQHLFKKEIAREFAYFDYNLLQDSRRSEFYGSFSLRTGGLPAGGSGKCKPQ